MALEAVRDRFEQARDLDQIGRIEDLELGGRWRARLGYSAPLFGGDAGVAVFDAYGRLGRRLTPRQTLVLDGRASGRWSGGRGENVPYGGSAIAACC